MTREGYAGDPLIFYPGAGLPATERDRMERYDISIGEITVDHLVYSMGRQIENNFQSFYSVAEELAGKETRPSPSPARSAAATGVRATPSCSRRRGASGAASRG
jgi:hypothetical protein